MKLVTAYLLAAALCVACTAAQWQKTKAHSVEVGFAGAGGAGAVLVAGPAGPFIFVGLSLVGILVSEQIQPPEGVTIITVDQDGKKHVEHFQPRQSEGGLAPQPMDHWYERVWTAVQVAWWVFVLLFILTHAKLRNALLGTVRWMWEAAGRKVTALIGMLKRK